ncbi:hypothetical protein BV911_03305 [Pseudoruegeria sp. SK021]|nr:hypothetical protein BV911_03305 [Pseudoruegeria sp. SK021]
MTIDFICPSHFDWHHVRRAAATVARPPRPAAPASLAVPAAVIVNLFVASHPVEIKSPTNRRTTNRHFDCPVSSRMFPSADLSPSHLTTGDTSMNLKIALIGAGAMGGAIGTRLVET